MYFYVILMFSILTCFEAPNWLAHHRFISVMFNLWLPEHDIYTRREFFDLSILNFVIIIFSPELSRKWKQEMIGIRKSQAQFHEFRQQYNSIPHYFSKPWKQTIHYLSQARIKVPFLELLNPFTKSSSFFHIPFSIVFSHTRNDSTKHNHVPLHWI